MRTENTSLLFGLVCAALAGSVVFYCARRWAPAFDPFGADLPPSATLALAIAPWLPLLLPLAILTSWLLSRPGKRRGHVAIGGGLAAMLLVLPAALAAMYLPLFKLAAVL